MASGWQEDAGDNWKGDKSTLSDVCHKLLQQKITPNEAFKALTLELQKSYDINRGFLALREDRQARFLAVARFTDSGTLKSLSLQIPSINSVFERVAEDGGIYVDNFAELFEGNTIENRLLIGEDTQSFVLRPLKSDGRLVGLLGYSSDVTDAFVTFEDGLLDPVIDCLTSVIVGTSDKVKP